MPGEVASAHFGAKEKLRHIKGTDSRGEIAETLRDCEWRVTNA